MTDSPEMIEDQIERTRQRIDARLASLTNQLSPSTLVQQAVGLQNSNPLELADAAIAKAKQNPLGAALVGAGLASLFMGKPALSENASMPDAEDVKAQAAVTKAKLSKKAERAKDTIIDTAIDTAEKARDTAKRSPAMVRGKAEGAADWVAENPVASGLMAIAVGAAISSVFASRPVKSRLEASEELHEQALAEDITSTRRATTSKAPVKKPKVPRTTAAAIKRSTAVQGSTGVEDDNSRSQRG